MENMHMEFDLLESVLGGSESPKQLKLSFLQSITNNFSDELKIGRGGCGVVYKGIVRNQIIALKRLLNSHTIEDKMFHREIKSMMMVNHKNIVRFLGYCSHTEEQAVKMEGKIIMAQDRERLLCFEYLINGSLEGYLTDELRGLEWQTRYQIIKGICDGLDQFHSENYIVHMDLKPANILLDSNMMPKITDFGLSRLDNISRTMNSERLVTLGYCAPEYLHDGKMSAKLDIYSLGIIILELVTGSKEDPNIIKVHRRWKHRWNKTAKDAQLGYKQVATCLDLARRCIQKDPTQRPNIWDIISYLNEVDSSDVKISDGTECLELDDMLGVEPLEIHLPFELNKQISCSVELTNDTNDDFAFRISTTSLRPYCIKADDNIVPARSKCIVTISLQAMDKALPGHQCRDDFSVQSTRLLYGGSLVGMNIGGGHIFNEEPGRVIDMVDFSVVLIGEAALPSPCTSSTTEQEAFSEQPEKDTVNPLTYQDNRKVPGRVFDMVDNYSVFLSEMASSTPWTSSTTEQEALSEQPEEDAVNPLAYKDCSEANYLLQLHEYMLWLVTLVANITYSMGTSPPGGFGSVNYEGHIGHNASFAYCLLTSVIVSIILVSSSLRWWLWRTLGIFFIMGAFGAAHSVLFARGSGKKVASRQSLVFAALVAGMAYQANLMSMLNLFSSVTQADDEHLLLGWEPKLRGIQLRCLMVAFLCFNIMLSLKLLMRRTVTCRGHGFCSWALRVCTGVALIGLTGAFSIWISGSLTTSICISALVVAVLLCEGLHQVVAFLRSCWKNWVRNSLETL